MSADVIPIASRGAEKAGDASPLRPHPFTRYRLALTGAARRSWRIARLTAECTGWMLFAGLVALITQ